MPDDPWAEFRTSNPADPWAEFRAKGPSSQDNDQLLANPGVRAGIAAVQPMIGAGQVLLGDYGEDAEKVMAPGGALAVLGPMGAAVGAVREIGKMTGANDFLNQKANQFADWAKQGRVAAGLGEKAEILDPGTWDLPATAGDILSPVNIVGGRAAGAVVGGTRAAGLGTRLAHGAGYGAAYGTTQPVTDEDTQGGEKSFLEAKLGQIGEGAIGGAIAGPLVGAAGDVIGPHLSDAVRYLLERGVRLTGGQTMEGVANRVEGALQSTPFTGEMVREARRVSTTDFNRVAHNETLENIGQRLPEDVREGYDAMAHTIDAISGAYRDVHHGMRADLNERLLRNLHGVVQEATGELDREAIDQLQRIINSKIINRFRDRNGSVTGAELQSLQSDMRELFRKMSEQGGKQDVAHYVDRARRAVDIELAIQNPAAARRLRDVNRAYAHQKILERATANPATLAYNGEFTPTQLGAAMTQKSGERQVARNRAFFQDLVRHGKSVIPNRVPDSGTPERMAVLGLLGIGGLHGFGPHAIAGMGAVGVGYTPLAQRLVRAAIAGGAETRGPIGDIVREYGPTVAVPLIAKALMENNVAQQEDVD